MKRALMIGLALACACATTPSAPDRSAGRPSNETDVTCRLIGSISGPSAREFHDPVIDELKSHGPTKVIWLNPPSTSVIRTVEGDVYRCNATL
jgi:hypothetical protein